MSDFDDEDVDGTAAPQEQEVDAREAPPAQEQPPAEAPSAAELMQRLEEAEARRNAASFAATRTRQRASSREQALADRLDRLTSRLDQVIGEEAPAAEDLSPDPQRQPVEFIVDRFEKRLEEKIAPLLADRKAREDQAKAEFEARQQYEQATAEREVFEGMLAETSGVPIEEARSDYAAAAAYAGEHRAMDWLKAYPGASREQVIALMDRFDRPMIEEAFGSKAHGVYAYATYHGYKPFSARGGPRVGNGKAPAPAAQPMPAQARSNSLEREARALAPAGGRVDAGGSTIGTFGDLINDDAAFEAAYRKAGGELTEVMRAYGKR